MLEVQFGRPSDHRIVTLPADAVTVETTPSYNVMRSRQHNVFFFQTTSYHAGILYLTRDDLMRMLAQLDANRPATPPS